jgi:hypothetical protein
MRKIYPTDLSDAKWEYIETHLPAPKATGRPRVYTLREILNAIFYIVRSGYAWRLLPHEFPPSGKPSTTTSGLLGAWTAPGSGYMPPCAIVCEYASRKILNLARA